MATFWLAGLLLCVHLVSVTAAATSCPTSTCPTINDIDLSPLSGQWETVYYTQAEGERNSDVPHFFNVSLCGPLASQCNDSQVCYSEHLQTYYNLGRAGSCNYEYDSVARQVRFTFEYSTDLVFGTGNVTVTLVCGRTLGVPEVLEGDPNSHAIDILWVTSAACKTSSSLAPNHAESKCYHVHSYTDNGLKANFIDLTNLIRPEGYVVSYPERPAGKFNVSICRPLEGDITTNRCAGSMACLIERDPGFSSSISPPVVIGNISGTESSLHMENGLLTVVYSVNVSAEHYCYDTDSGVGSQSVKIHFLCPSANQDLGPRITFLDDHLCLMVLHWYTSYACGNSAIQTSGCTLTTTLGLTFDLSGLSNEESITSSTQVDSHGGVYRYEFYICSAIPPSRDCVSDNGAIRVTQFDSGGICRVLGVGDGKLRYVDGDLSLTYGLGDTCHSNFARTTIINFVCPENVASNASVISYLGEEDCFYQFEWVTPLACGVQDSGVSSCQFENLGGVYDFAPLVGTADKNWIALDTDVNTECFMINPCGGLAVTPDKLSAVEYCNKRLAPSECAQSSVCQITKKNNTFVKVGHFDFGTDPQNTTQVHSVDSSVITVVGNEMSSNLSAVVHYVCKVGDLTTPPIFIGITNDVIYEFHWMTYAACPAGVETGADCTVAHHSTGFVFNLTSLPLVTFSQNGYLYSVSVCKPLSASQSNCTETTAAVCQNKGGNHYSLGNSNSILVYEDGTLKLHYTGGKKCNHAGQPSRNSTLLFICDNTAHAPVINDVNEDYCDYVIEVRTKLACPPAYQAHSCIYFDKDNHTYDFSPLTRSSQNGNWEARGRDGALYYINVCQPLNAMIGCNPLSAVCKVQVSDGRTSYTNIALASSANFTSLHVTESGAGATDGLNSVTLTYEYKNVGDVGCPVVTTRIKFVCDNTTINVETGPTYLSGGDEGYPCEYLFSWQTVYACPVLPTIVHNSCAIQGPSGYTFNLTSLTSANSTQTFFNSGSPDGHQFHISVCAPLDHSCSNDSDIGSIAVCQEAVDNKKYSCGRSSTQTLTYFDSSLKMSYIGGDLCRHNNKNRSVLINFECDRTLSNYKGSPHFVSENEDCGYTFDWPTSLACLPRELECIAEGGRYDLRPLLQDRVWVVKNGINDYHYVVGGCRSLDFTSVPQCPQTPWMGACRYQENTTGSGTALGYITGDIIEEKGNSLVLAYHNGDCSGGKRGVVYITFLCGEDAGNPQLTEDNQQDCVVQIQWTTKYACSRDAKILDWSVEDPVTNQVFNLSLLEHSLSRVYTESDRTQYNYTVGLGGYPVICPRSWKNDTGRHVGACQRRLFSSSGANADSHDVHALGYINKNTTLQYSGGHVSVVYRNGDECHHIQTLREAIISFECEQSTRTFLEVAPETDCGYTFVVHTNLVCRQGEDIGIQCFLDGYNDLELLSGLDITRVPVNSTAHAYLSVCGTLSVDVSDVTHADMSACPDGAAACLINGGVAVHLGKPSRRYPVKELPGKNGVLLKYIEGDDCLRMRGTKYSTSLLLVCNRNIPVGAPEFVEERDCEFIFRWESIHACRINLAYSNTSNDVCTIDDESSEFVYDFTNLIKSQNISAVDTQSNTTYFIQLCGNQTSLPPGTAGCDKTNTGVCRKRSNEATAMTVVKASHKFVITSHAPHTVDIHYDSGSSCGSDDGRTYEALVSLQCSTRESSTMNPIFQREEECTLYFVWQNSSFCVEEESCSTVDVNGNIYNLDGLFAQTWTGLVTVDSAHKVEDGSTFTMSFCRNLNPFSGRGSHCSSPSGICWHTAEGGHLNLGHMTGPPFIHPSVNSDPHVTIQAFYMGGDVCNSTSNSRYQTTVYLHCAAEVSSPILSLYGDATNQDANCTWTVSMETPLACPPKVNFTDCVIETSVGSYDFTPLGNPLQFTMPGSATVSVCLCKSSACHKANISSSVGGNVTDLGTYHSTVVSTTTGGPRLTFINGAPCSGGTIRTIIFMECDRLADKKQGSLSLTSLSDDCHKYFFWSTPFACVSEEISCSVATDTLGMFYDFSPLHSQGKPWTATLGGSTYYINICGPIENRATNEIEKCGSESSVCLKNSQGAVSLGRTSTQRILSPGGYVAIVFGGGPVTCGGHVTIHMECGVGGITALPPESCYHATQFSWKTPYACGQNKPVLATECTEVIAPTGGSHFEFHPKELQHTTRYSTTDGVTYYVNLCGQAVGCGVDVSVCDSNNNSIASYKHQTIMAEGYQLLFQMSMSDTGSTTHAVVRVVCLLQGDTSGLPLPGPSTLELENIGAQNDHTYYYFVLYTTQGCKFDESTAVTPTAPSGEPPGVVATAGGSVTTIILVLLAIALIVVVVMVIIFYKKERREYVKHALEKLIIGKADEPVKYHRVSRENEDEETALMDGDSEDSDSGEGSEGVSGEGGGGRVRVEVDLTQDNKETNNSDEELINL